MNKIKYLIYLVLLILFDQVTKILVVDKLKGNAPFELIPGVFEFYYHENTGAVWGILSDQTMLLALISIVILAGIGFYFYKLPKDKHFDLLRLVLVFIAAGAVGNLIDRVFRKFVVDFLYFKLIDFPIFNIADIYVTVSAIALVVLTLFYYKDDELDVFTKKR